MEEYVRGLLADIKALITCPESTCYFCDSLRKELAGSNSALSDESNIVQAQRLMMDGQQAKIERLRAELAATRGCANEGNKFCAGFKTLKPTQGEGE